MKLKHEGFILGFILPFLWACLAIGLPPEVGSNAFYFMLGT